jgi:hypothetical protein
MFYFPTISSSFKEVEYKRKVNDKLNDKLNDLKNDVDNLVHWNKRYVDESNTGSFIDGIEYNQDYLELQRIITKLTS